MRISLTITLFWLFFTSTIWAHLGEEHPEGQHKYFPDIPRADVMLDVEELPHSRGTWWTDAHAIPGREGQLMLSSRFQYQSVLTESGKRTYLRTGEDYGWSVEGMSAFEFHPGFNEPENPGYGKFYTLTTDLDFTTAPDFISGGDTTLHNVLQEWTVDDPASDIFSGTSRELIRFQQNRNLHNVNDLEFGNDGTLFIAVGEDLQDAAAAQLDSAFGKILRIDPLGSNSANGRYGIPQDNPFVHDPNVVSEIYAYGLRNPWRMTVDQETGALWAFDVGRSSIEEVNKVVPGGNYGWPIKEGSMLNAREAFPDEPDPVTGLTRAEADGLIDPVFEYDHMQGVTVVGGLVYHGDEFPWLKGKVIFADLGMGSVSTPAPRVFYGDPETGEMFELISEETVDTVWGQTCNYRGESVSCAIYSVNEGADGEILLLGKSLMRIVPVPASQSGDFDQNGSLNAADLSLLAGAKGEDLVFDVNVDGVVDFDDRATWVTSLKGTWFGDSNLDGEFNSTDLVTVFVAGEYEDNIPMNSNWGEGDWNGDSEFDSQDIILAFQGGGFEMGRRDTEVIAVPEPASSLLILIGALAALQGRRRFGA